MHRVRLFLSRLAEVTFRGRREQRLLAEIEHHLDMLTDEFKSRGMSDADARLAARREFGGVDQVRMRHRAQRGWPIVDSLTQDLRFAVRVLARDRGFALTAMLVLGVGLGVNNLFFTLFYAHKVRGVPIEDADRVLSVSTFDDRANDRLLSIPEFNNLAQAQTSFGATGAYVTMPVTVGDQGRAPDRFDAAYVTAGAFEVLGIKASLGHLPDAASDRPGAQPVAVLGADAWASRYASDPGILGRTILVNGFPVTVVGIIPERSGFPSTASVWMPLGQLPEWKPDRSVRTLRVIGRLRSRVGEAEARAEIETLFAQFEAAHSDANRNVRARVVPLNVRLLGSLEGWMQFIFAGIIVILVACANVANLMIARALHRAPEIAIRVSLGASRLRVIAQLVMEAALIAAGGAVVGTLFSLAAVRMVEAGIPAGILPYWLDYSMDRTVFLTLLAVATASIIVFGVLPALHAARTDPNRTLKDGGRNTTASPAMRIWTDAFLTVQLALAMILVAQVTIVAYLANETIPTDQNINTTAVITAAVTLPAAAYRDATSRETFFDRLEERLRARPEISGHSRATALPGEGVGALRLHIRGQEQAPGAPPLMVPTIQIAPQYFDGFALRVLRGRDFTRSDGVAEGRQGGGAESAIVNERFAEVFLAGADPLGMQIAVTPSNAPAESEPRWVTIVGVSPTIRQQGTGGAFQQPPVVYMPISGSAPATSTMIVRHRVSPEAAAAILREEALAVDPDVPLFRMRTLERAVREAQWNGHTSAVLADTVTFMSVLLAIVGLYAVTAQRVTLRTREIGLRMALGARSLQIAQTTIAGLRMALVFGLLLGTAGAMAWDGSFSSGVSGMYASAPPTLFKVGALLVAFVLLSCAVPVWRATRTNPVAALRHE